ncbi:hypothetical protein HUJ04_003873 [Dendroctonus ponderosae]|nr:hypothetical protein HUJ04_003873 [Dendroctonus ponderosae]
MTPVPLVIITQIENSTKYAESPDSKLISNLGLLKEAGNDSVKKVIYDDQPDLLTPQLLKDLLGILKPEGQLEIVQFVDATEFNLKTAGFVNVAKKESSVTALKPKYAVGSSVKLNLKKATVWKLDDDDEDDLIDPDDLLDEDDLKKPDPTSLRDCSCGLADELTAEAQSGKIVNTSDAPKSSCGSCYLGDAFRCATCPYLGMPAFKPGEKIQLSSLQLKSDI